MNLEVLVATMNQTDLSLYNKMNIHSDLIIANQCEYNNIQITSVNNNNVKMISTNTKGVGLNRNIALLASTADILLLSDDDVIYHNDYKEKVLEAFQKYPKADVIVFGMKLSRNGEVYRIKKLKNQKLNLLNIMKFGTYSIAIRNTVVQSKRLTFSHLFGGGCEFGSGEDSLFLIDCLRNGLKIYSNEYVLGVCAKDSSSWFSGYTDKYFYDKGAWFSHAFPKSPFIIRNLYCMHIASRANKNYRQVCGVFKAGAKNISELISYNDFMQQKKW